MIYKIHVFNNDNTVNTKKFN